MIAWIKTDGNKGYQPQQVKDMTEVLELLKRGFVDMMLTHDPIKL